MGIQSGQGWKQTWVHLSEEAVGESVALDGKQKVGKTHPSLVCAWKHQGLWYKIVFHQQLDEQYKWHCC